MKTHRNAQHYGKLLGNSLPASVSELRADELLSLCFPSRHSQLLDSRRAGMILSRTRFVALLFAILTPIWGVLDWLFLPADIALPMVIGRLVATYAFVVLLRNFCEPDIQTARRALQMLFAIPTVFYFFSTIYLGKHSLTGFAGALSATHEFLPFVILAGLPMFPLALMESMMLAVPVLGAHIAASLLFYPDMALSAAIGTLWLLGLMTAVLSLASASQLAFIIMLVRHAMRDPLTACYTRQSGEELLDLQFIVAKRTERPMAIAFIDIDHFKKVNDSYGHDAGDRVLSETAQHFMDGLRASDMCVRWGGEEFVVLMPNTTIEVAKIALERIRESGMGMRPDGSPITASIGVADSVETPTHKWMDLVERADQRMYVAKQSGRDRIVIAGGNHDADADEAAACNNDDQSPGNQYLRYMGLNSR